MAKAIAAELGKTGSGAGYIVCGNDTVTWCVGHMLEQAEPDVYTSDAIPRNDKGKKIWRAEDLPIIPVQWQLNPKTDLKDQLLVIGKLLKQADEVVNAGDCDREGQLLVDEVLELFDYRKKVSRFWVSAQDSLTVQRGLRALVPNEKYKGFADAARGRSRADWLIGMNLTRAFTLRAKRGGTNTVVTVGRVQTPTLALVVARDREIASFKPIPYYTVRVAIQHPETSFAAKWRPVDDSQVDIDGRLVNAVLAQQIVDAVSGAPGTVTAYEQEPKQIKQRLTYSLSDITADASRRYGYGAEAVLAVCQSLYDQHKLTSYPRTDCAYLPESQHMDATRVFDALAVVNPELVKTLDGADLTIKSRVWNDKKITAHHGIVPTAHPGDKTKLSVEERNIYDLIVLAYIAQFYPVHEFMQTTVHVNIQGHTFSARGRVVTQRGWHAVAADVDESKQEDDPVDNQKLPPMSVGAKVTCVKAQLSEGKTKAPERFTEGTLMRAMENIHRVVDDAAHKKLLRDGDGIGTSATRPSIIGELKRRAYLEPSGKSIVSTALGKGVIDALPEVVRSPVLTALFERVLKDVETGTASLDEFCVKQEAFIKDQVAKANAGAVTVAGAERSPIASTIYTCRACNHGLVKKPSKWKGRYWWSCSNYPSCNQSYKDVNSQPEYQSSGEKA